MKKREIWIFNLTHACKFIFKLMFDSLKYFGVVFFLFLLFSNYSNSSTQNQDQTFDDWLSSYKIYAHNEGVSKETINLVFKNVKFLDNVIKYDRKQPEFYEDTLTYVNKRANKFRVQQAKNKYIKNKNLLDQVEREFKVQKEILLSLWGIETNYGKHVGKMDIISSLATLSFDKRRRDFFSSELLILLKLIDKNLIDPKTLYGSWAGAYGNFQFMPSTINSYAIDYDKNNKIELKTSIFDSLASAANYISKIGWKFDEPCFYRVKLNKDIHKRYINSSARNIKNRLSINKWKKKGIVNFDGSDLSLNYNAALILPDGKKNTPAYLVFQNYERILKWNRSLRFAISVCTLAQKIKL